MGIDGAFVLARWFGLFVCSYIDMTGWGESLARGVLGRTGAEQSATDGMSISSLVPAHMPRHLGQLSDVAMTTVEGESPKRDGHENGRAGVGPS